MLNKNLKPIYYGDIPYEYELINNDSMIHILDSLDQRLSNLTVDDSFTVQQIAEQLTEIVKLFGGTDTTKYNIIDIQIDNDNQFAYFNSDPQFSGKIIWGD